MRTNPSEYRAGAMRRNALSAALAAGLLTAVTPAAPSTGADATTGTYLDGDRAAERLPLIVLDRETIEFSGKTSVADLLRDLPHNSFGSPRPQSGSSAQSFAGLSLRGLGVGRTLILLDGRRLPVAPSTGQGQNLEAVPLAAVERIEILPAGGSAIHGSDAIGGVVNIITRKDLTGAELTIGRSDPERPGGATEQGSALFGTAGARGRVMAGVSYNSRDIVFARDRHWSRGGASIFSNNFLNSNFTFLEHPQFGSANVPACQGPGFSLSERASQSCCFYDPTLVSADEAGTSNESAFFRASYALDPDWTLSADAMVSRVESFGREAPVPSAPWPAGEFGAIVLRPDSPNHPAMPPEQGGLNPSWEAYQEQAGQTLLLVHRFAANGPLDTNTDANTYDLDIGLQGRLATFDVDLGVRRAESQYFELGRNHVVPALAQPSIDSGAYDIYRPFAVPQDDLQSFTATVSRNARTVQTEAHARARTDLPLDLGAGPARLALDAEYTEEDYRDTYGDLSANDNVIGAAGRSSSGRRSHYSALAELRLPLTDGLALDGALRYAEYSDSGSAVSPSLGVRWQPFDELSVYASWERGFRAPPLDIMAAQPAFSTAIVVHEPTGEFLDFGGVPIALEIDTYSIANPELDSEKSNIFGVGFAFEPVDWFGGSVNFWRIELEDRLSFIGPQQILNCLEGLVERCPPGLSRFPAGSGQPDPGLGLGAEFGDQGQVIFVQSGIGNLGGIDSDGADIELRTGFELGSGRLVQKLLATYSNRFELDGGDNVAGKAGLPEWRAVLSNVYRLGDLAFSWNINHIGGQDSSLALGDDGSLPSWTTHDVQGSWDLPWNGRISIGVDNLTDEDPVLDPGELLGFNFDLYDGYGRIGYLRYRQTW